MAVDCLSVCPSVCPVLTLSRERKDIGNRKFAGMKPMTRLTRDPI